MSPGAPTKELKTALIDICLGPSRPWRAGRIDADALYGLACDLRVEGFVLDRLATVQDSLSTDESRLLAALRERVAQTAISNIRADQELGVLADRLARSGVAVVVLKGAGYRLGRPGRAGRFQCDLDILVRKENLERAEAVMLERGYLFDGSYQRRDAYLRDHFHVPYRRDGFLVDLHWQVDPVMPAGFIERLWRRSRVHELDGAVLRFPGPEHQVLLASLHISRHAFLNALRWLCDLRSELPLTAEVAHGLIEEAAHWPGRAVWAPFWVLAESGVTETPGTRGRLDAGPVERAVVKSLISSHLHAEPWCRLPLWLTCNALRDWLRSGSPLVRTLASHLLGAAR